MKIRINHNASFGTADEVVTSIARHLDLILITHVGDTFVDYDLTRRTDSPRISVLHEVADERERQEELRRAGKSIWTCADPDQSNARKLAVLAEEFGEIAREVTEEMIASDKMRIDMPTALFRRYAADTDKIRANMREELIQIAAVAVAWAESLPRKL